MSLYDYNTNGKEGPYIFGIAVSADPDRMVPGQGISYCWRYHGEEKPPKDIAKKIEELNRRERLLYQIAEEHTLYDGSDKDWRTASKSGEEFELRCKREAFRLHPDITPWAEIIEDDYAI